MISKRVLIIILICASVILVVVMLPAGFFNIVADGQAGKSKSIGESKLRGVFIAEYYSPQEVQVINGNIKVHVKEAWLERKWYYKLFSIDIFHKSIGG